MCESVELLDVWQSVRKQSESSGEFWTKYTTEHEPPTPLFIDLYFLFAEFLKALVLRIVARPSPQREKWVLYIGKNCYLMLS